MPTTVPHSADYLPLTIRTAAPSEWARVGELAVSAYSAGGHVEAAGQGAYLDVVRDVAGRAHPGPVLVAERGGATVGTVTICPPGTSHAEIGVEGEIEFRFLAVDPEAVGTGVGRALTEAVISFAGEVGAQRVVCSVIDWNESAHRLYEATGFERVPARDWSPVPDVFLQVYSRMP